MASHVRFRRRALRRLEASVAAYGTNYGDAVAAWLDALAVECASGRYRLSVDAEAFFKQWAMDAPLARRGTPLATTVRERIERILAQCGLARPPRELRAAQEVFVARNDPAGVPGETPVIVTVFFQVLRAVQPPRMVVLVYRAPH